MYCNKCGASILDDEIFCTSCGSPIDTEADETAILLDAEANTTHCINCGENISDNAFCTSCGTPVHVGSGSVVSTIPMEDYILPQVSRLFEDTYQPRQIPTTMPRTDFSLYADISPSEEPIKEKKRSSTMIIAAIVAVFVLLLGLGIYLLLDTGKDNDINGQAEPSEELQQHEESGLEHTPSPEATPSPEPKVESIELKYDGETISYLSIFEDEHASLSVSIIPFGVETDIVWTSSDPGIFIVSSVNVDGTEALLTGISCNEALLTVTAGGAVQTCVVQIIERPTEIPSPPEHDFAPGKVLFEAIQNSGARIHLKIFWDNGTETLFVMEPKGDWIMHSRNGDIREVLPSFTLRDNTLEIRFPTTPRIYFLYDNYTGIFGDEKLNWSYETE